MAPDGASPPADDGTRPEPEAAIPPPGFFGELAEAFARHRPQGSVRWNFWAAVGLLQRAFPGRGTAEHLSESAPAPARRLDLAGATARLRRGRERRPAAPTRPAWTPGQEIPEAPDGAELRYEAALRTTIEALIYLSARVDELEAERHRRDQPLDGPARLVPALDVSPWAPAVMREIGAPSALVVHAECGAGGLLDALVGAGIVARGVEPRAELAWEAARRGHQVAVGDPLGLLGALAPHSLGALVLSGVVDRAPLVGLLGLLETSVALLAPGAPVVVIGAGPDAGGPPAVLDLSPGRPLHAESWGILLERAGLGEVARLGGGDGRPGFAVVARAPRDGP
jgi:hypothetical protein